jgi:hypothetical protein
VIWWSDPGWRRDCPGVHAAKVLRAGACPPVALRRFELPLSAVSHFAFRETGHLAFRARGTGRSDGPRAAEGPTLRLLAPFWWTPN